MENLEKGVWHILDVSFGSNGEIKMSSITNNEKAY